MDSTCNSCKNDLPNVSDRLTCCGPQSVTTKSNMEVSGIVSVMDSSGKELTFSINTPPINGAALVNSSSGAWIYTPNPNYVGKDIFTIKAANSDCVTCITTIEVDVQAQAPCCSVLCPLTILMGSGIAGSVKVLDSQNQKIMYGVSAQSVNGTLELNEISGEWHYRPDDGFIGKDSFSVRATNQSGLWCDLTQSINVVSFCAGLTKTVSTENVCLNCPFDYVITAANTGSIPIENCIITDIFPKQLEIIGIQLNGEAITGNLCTGINIGCLESGMEAILKVTVKVLCNSLVCPFQNMASGSFKAILNPWEPAVEIIREAVDCVGISVREPKLQIMKSADQSMAAVGEVLTFSLVIRNCGNVPLVNVNILDSLDPILQFQVGSVMINDMPAHKENIVSGVVIPILKINETAKITFKAALISQGQGVLENQAIGTYDYTGCETNSLTSGEAVSNLVKTIVKNPCLQVEKEVDKSLAILEETLTYSITIINNGDVDALNVMLKDSLSPAVRYLKDTLKVNGRLIHDSDLDSGVYLGNIVVNEKVKVQYMVQVVTLVHEGVIRNEAFVNFGYSAGPCSPIKRKDSQAACTKTCLAISLFKELNLKSNLAIRRPKPDIELINSITGRVDHTDFYIIRTSVSTSREGQNLTGYKLICHGILNLEVEYTADDEEQTVFSEHYSEPFSSFVVLQPNFNSDSIVNVRTVVENIYFKQTSNRCFFTNATLLVIVNAK